MANGIGESTVELLKQHGINSIEELATSNVERISKIEGIGVSDAKRYIYIAKKQLESIKSKETIFQSIKERFFQKT
jgi:predicted RecB family nuclease